MFPRYLSVKCGALTNGCSPQCRALKTGLIVMKIFSIIPMRAADGAVVKNDLCITQMHSKLLMFYSVLVILITFKTVIHDVQPWEAV